MELLAAEEVVVLEVEVTNPEALLDDDVVVLEKREVAELELLVVEEDVMLEVESVDAEEASSVEDVLDDVVV